MENKKAPDDGVRGDVVLSPARMHGIVHRGRGIAVIAALIFSASSAQGEG